MKPQKLRRGRGGFGKLAFDYLIHPVSLTTAPATPLGTPNAESKHLSLHRSRGGKQEGIWGTHFSRGMCRQGILASVPTPACVKVQRCGVAMTSSVQGKPTCPLPVWQWQGWPCRLSGFVVRLLPVVSVARLPEAELSWEVSGVKGIGKLGWLFKLG